MTRASKKRKLGPPNSSTVTSSTAGSDTASDRGQRKGYVRIDKLFDKYANNSLDMIDPEGIMALCSDLKVEHTDVRMLMLAWKLKAQKQGYFTQDEWRAGLKALQVDTLTKLKAALQQLEQEVMEPINFKDFYSFAFRYCLTEERQKCVDIGTACELLSLVLVSQFHYKVEHLIEYLKSQADYKGINHDQWMCFLRFFNEISFTDFDNYDSTESWPSILDNFVEWMKAKK